MKHAFVPVSPYIFLKACGYLIIIRTKAVLYCVIFQLEIVRADFETACSPPPLRILRHL